MAGQSLADFGARVLKVERPPIGEPMGAGNFHAWQHQQMSSYFAATNRNKQSVSLDLMVDAGSDALHARLKDVDVLLNNC